MYDNLEGVRDSGTYYIIIIIKWFELVTAMVRELSSIFEDFLKEI